MVSEEAVGGEDPATGSDHGRVPGVAEFILLRPAGQLAEQAGEQRLGTGVEPTCEFCNFSGQAVFS